MIIIPLKFTLNKKKQYMLKLFRKNFGGVFSWVNIKN